MAFCFTTIIRKDYIQSSIKIFKLFSVKRIVESCKISTSSPGTSGKAGKLFFYCPPRANLLCTLLETHTSSDIGLMFRKLYIFVRQCGDIYFYDPALDRSRGAVGALKSRMAQLIGLKLLFGLLGRRLMKMYR